LKKQGSSTYVRTVKIKQIYNLLRSEPTHNIYNATYELTDYKNLLCRNTTSFVMDLYIKEHQAQQAQRNIWKLQENFVAYIWGPGETN